MPTMLRSSQMQIIALTALVFLGLCTRASSEAAQPASSLTTRGTSQAFLADQKIYHFGQGGCIAGAGTCVTTKQLASSKSTKGNTPASCKLPTTQDIAFAVSSENKFLTSIGDVQLASSRFGDCVKFNLNGELNWISSATAIHDSGLVMIDVYRRGLYRLFHNGKLRAEDTDLSSSDSFPWQINRYGRYYLLLASNLHGVLLNEDFKVLFNGNLTIDNGETTNGIRSIIDWTVLGDELYGYGSLDVPGHEGPLHGVLFRSRIQAPLHLTDIEILTVTSPNEGYSTYYQIPNKYITANNNGVYFLMMAPSPEVIFFPRHQPNQFEIISFPLEEFSRLKEIKTKVTGPLDGPKLYEETEEIGAVVSVHGKGDSLYALARRPIGETTSWALLKFETSENKYVGHIDLPTSARHLSVAPGGDVFFAIEKGAVHSYNKQDIDSVIVMPSEWFREPYTSPLKKGLRCGESPAHLLAALHGFVDSQ